MNIRLTELADTLIKSIGKPEKTYLFVYGTLKHDIYPPKTEKMWKPDAIDGEMYDLGDYPGAKDVGHSPGHIKGEVIEIDPKELASIDKREDVARGDYKRKKVRTKGGIEAWTYEYKKKIPKTAKEEESWKLEKGLKGNWKKEGHTWDHEFDNYDGMGRLVIYSYDKKKKPSGQYSFSFIPHPSNEFKADPKHEILVDGASTVEAHRRKGLASHAYRLAEKKLGGKVSPGDQSEDAVDLWAQPNRPFGKSRELKKDLVPGGKGDKASLSSFDPKEVEMGRKVEMEHTSNPKVAEEIEADHLSENPKYYSGLKAAGLADELKKMPASFAKLKKAYEVKGTIVPLSTDKEGSPHPFKPYYKGTLKNGKPAWFQNKDIQERNNYDLMRNFTDFIKGSPLSRKGEQQLRDLGKMIANDPDKHAIPTGEDDQSMRLRHLSNALAGTPGYSIVEDNGLKITAPRHSGRTDKAAETHTWHFDGKSLKFLGKNPMSKSKEGGYENPRERLELTESGRPGSVPKGLQRQQSEMGRSHGGAAKGAPETRRGHGSSGLGRGTVSSNDSRRESREGSNDKGMGRVGNDSGKVVRPDVLKKSESLSVSTVAVIDGDKLLMGKRRDNGKWTNPGGRSNPGESPEDAAIRELYEETMIRAKDLKPLGEDRIIGKDGKARNIHCFAMMGRPKASGAIDPDGEVSKWVWIDVSNGLPDHVANNLHSPKNVLLRLLGLQDDK